MGNKPGYVQENKRYLLVDMGGLSLLLITAAGSLVKQMSRDPLLCGHAAGD